MTQGHLKSGETISLKTLKEDMSPDSTFALVKTSAMEVIRMVLPEGKKVNEHRVNGEITVQCLKGSVQFSVGRERHELEEGDWLYLKGSEPHSISALADSVLLVTILFSSDS